MAFATSEPDSALDLGLLTKYGNFPLIRLGSATDNRRNLGGVTGKPDNQPIAKRPGALVVTALITISNPDSFYRFIEPR